VLFGSEGFSRVLKGKDMVIWKNDPGQERCRVAIAGDFLPSAQLTPPPRRTWSDMACALRNHFADVDLSIVNLECPLGVEGLSPRVKFGLGANFAGPVESLEYLSFLRTGIVGIANNHIYDFGARGLSATKRAVLRANMCPIGAGSALSDSPDFAIWQGPKRVRVGCWAAARGLQELASSFRAGVEPATLKRGLSVLQKMAESDVRFKIALLHLGMEHTNRPDPDDVELMRSLAKSGFDVVAAAHSHRVSGWDLSGRNGATPSFCFYGLGSLTSSVIYSSLEREGLVVVVGLDSHGNVVRVEARPVYLQDAGWGTEPQVCAGEIEERLLSLSLEISTGAYKRRFYEEVGRDLLVRQLRDFRAAIRNGGFKGVMQKIARLRARHLKQLARAALD
jgi:Bacterial capsule synthesis protein PGA_cap